MRAAALVLCALLVSGSCREESRDGEPSAALPRLELVRVERRTRAIMNDGEEASAVFVLVHEGHEPLEFWGLLGEQPSYRLAYLVDGRWVEGRPSWLECGTGLDVGLLQPGERVELDVWVARPDLPFRVAAGLWSPGEDPRPPWTEWRWTWSDTIVLDDQP